MSSAFDDDERGEEGSMQASGKIGKSAEQQGSNLPVGWKPTAAEPVPVVRCTAIKKDGKRCGRWSLRGTTVCYTHGGRLNNVQEHANAVVEAARLRLVGIADDAVDVIEDLMHNASQDAIRLKAAQDVLDRSGVRGAIEIDVAVTQTETPAERIAKRLQKIAEREHIKNAPPTEDELEDQDNIVDAEVEEDDAS